jgi:regulator of sigma E protease
MRLLSRSDMDGAADLAVVRNKADAGGWPQALLAPETLSLRLPAGQPLERGIASASCVTKAVMKGSRAEEIGLRKGDIIWSLDGRQCRHWGFLESTLGSDPETSHSLVWLRGDGEHTVERTDWISLVTDKESRGDMQIRTFGLATHPPMSRALDAIPNEHRLSYAVTDSITRTHEVIRMNVAAITGLFSGKVPLTELSGPIGIAQMAARTTERGWGYFFSLMVWLSVSLGLLNLLPIPILDGGHILFLALEGIKRRPVSLRTRQIASYVGLAFIMMLFILAFKNDLERPW